MKVTQLIIKIKSLAAESRIIREEERKLSEKIKSYKKRHQVKELDEKSKHLEWTRQNLYEHRKWVVGQEARRSLIVRRMMKGFSYAEIEPESKSGVDLQKICDMAIRFGMDKAEVWKWILETQKTFKERKFYSNPVKVYPHKRLTYPINKEDLVVLTQEVLDAYTYQPTKEEKKGIRARILAKLTS